MLSWKGKQQKSLKVFLNTAFLEDSRMTDNEYDISHMTEVCIILSMISEILSEYR